MEHMCTEKTWQMQSTSSADTEALGERVGARLKGGEVLELLSDLGGGKTTFVRGLARGAGSTDAVASPTFTISREYRASKYTIVHFDFYRLDEPGIIAEELREVINDPLSVVVIEWGDIVQDVLPQQRLSLHIAQTGDETRDITCQYAPELAYLLAGEKQ
ncbi:tRNA (adenosine(37)-N6)-threonylcarbamoyltransferase complex ATPase subunit type 1 TsaE [Candidatus Saccharibacteria bacterium]|nr:MAG: tRNA (adenosine(37)-N6)-threonylcarbamoyltransferase complex ATPase subunit type 1 TsaE [Candidatus Saccharibacteria bacterium]PID99015.1 MAG: tRNA (adenosine(37)-N6)-threonylcarbamoyltransferase complex ATPase subunit type 1 TsaE [Candidatus Saccharibacteria bacterium]